MKSSFRQSNEKPGRSLVIHPVVRSGSKLNILFSGPDWSQVFFAAKTGNGFDQQIDYLIHVF